MKINGGIALARALGALGVSEAFVLHGGHLDSFLVACKDESIHLTDTRHESSAGHAAAAYARATGRVGVCAITAGPGFTNALTAIADAHLDAVPVLFISSSPPLREVEQNVLQGGIDQVLMAAPVTKWAHRATDVERLPDLVDKAIRTALAGRPGPVYLEVPIDIMFAPFDDLDLRLPTVPSLATRPAPAPAAVARILDLLAGAERPAVIIGGGAARSPGCGEQLATFHERTGIPIVTGTKAVGVLPMDHPGYLGPVSVLAAAAFGAKQPADVVLQIGVRSGMFLGGRAGAIVPDDATLVHVDLDGVELGRMRTPEVAVVADAAETFAALNAALTARPVTAPPGWIALLRTLRERMSGAFSEIPGMTDSGFIHPAAAARAVVDALSPDTAFVFDGGETPAWVMPMAKSPGPGLVMGNGYLGTLGVGPGFAIGLARSRPGKPVALVTGDGAAGFHIAEFDTMARHGLPITTVVFNNASWGISQHGQELVFGKENTTVVHLARSAYHTVAEAFGCVGVQVDRIEDMGPAVVEAQRSGRPTCLNVMTDPDVIHPNIERMVGASDNEKEIVIPYYENIPVRS
jgi:acetolactate synthase-1/2/3 large subunit